MSPQKLSIHLPLWLSAAAQTIAHPLALLLVCLVGFVPAIDGLGFYWDDWPSIWFLHNWGPASFQYGFSTDRPLLAWIFMLTTPILGESALNWQIFGVLTRWLAGVSLWWTLRGLWPRDATPAAWAALLFILYPGFSQQYISVTYSNAFLVFALFIFSLGSMIRAMNSRSANWLWGIASLTASALTMFIAEYFFGLELLRPALLWMLDSRAEAKPVCPWKERLRRVFLRWLPYLIFMFAFVAWRVFFHENPRGEIMIFDRLRAAPLLYPLLLLYTIAQDFYEVNFLAWIRSFDITILSGFENRVWINYIIITVCGALLALFYILRSAKDIPLEPQANATGKTFIARWSKPWASEALILGFYACLVAGWPIWITNLHIELIFPWDRFTLSTMIPVSLFLTGLVGMLAKKRWSAALTLAILAGAAAGYQYQQRLLYRQEWLAQKNFFWQLTWRVPTLQPGTTLLTSEIPFPHYSDNSLTAPLNWAYAPQLDGVPLPSGTPIAMPYLMFDIEARLGTQWLSSLDPGTAIQYPYRITNFNGSTSQAILFFYDPPRCVKVVDPSIDRYLPVKPLYIKEALPLSRLDLILPEPANASSRLEEVFGPEPIHDWCYYFEQADLYRQQGDWPKTAAAADKALKINKHFTQKNVSELLPFIDGYAHTGQWKKAVELTFQAYQIWDKMQFILCDAWDTIASAPLSPEGQVAFSQVKTQLQCTSTPPGASIQP